MKIIQKITFVIIFVMIFQLDVMAQIPQPEESKGLVVFYRQKKFSGGGIKFSVKDSSKNYGQLKNGAVIKINAQPGENTFFSQVISSDAITVSVEEGKVYYVQAKVKTGALAGRPKFSLVDEKKALKALKDLKWD